MFKNKKVVITGASRGIGLEIAREFLAAGAYAAICASGEQNLKAAKDDLERRAPGRVFAKRADVSNAQECEDFINAAHEAFGAIDVLVNNAGVTKDALAVRLSEEDWDKVLDTNLKGAFFMSKAALKIMMKARQGSIVNMSSVVGQSGNAAQANYSASKAGVIGLTKALAKEFASRNIRVNAVAPGFVTTDMTDKLGEDIKISAMESIPLKRFANAGDIANAVMFLASEKAGYITGQVLAVNGGLYI
ncbi:MAG: 3-oxoacyl-[acyl-carrier-protein] reductase [Elusimicrobiota bacterium]|jgi:3-oxoacyl-[acyl-carrier protein] reductase|nr:3-oxoacyl-[acyl-carrier-protein] reductase [Elusimicrobiota bacterium]